MNYIRVFRPHDQRTHFTLEDSAFMFPTHPYNRATNAPCPTNYAYKSSSIPPQHPSHIFNSFSIITTHVESQHTSIHPNYPNNQQPTTNMKTSLLSLVALLSTLVTSVPLNINGGSTSKCDCAAARACTATCPYNYEPCIYGCAMQSGCGKPGYC